MTLHEAIVQVLKNTNRSMTTQEIANELNRTKAYQKRDGSAISAFQIHGRTRTYPHLFDRDSSLVSLVGESRSNSQSDIEPTKKTIVSSSTGNIAKSKLSEKLMNELNYKPASEIDTLVPDSPGLYSVRIKNIDSLPKPFSTELSKLGHNLIYIGIASQSLNRRMLNQELRAKGHGTFFRSIGAVLGCKPPANSLANKKNKRNYKFSPSDETKIIHWINENLLINWVEQTSDLEEVETSLILKYRPLLNIAKNPKALPELSALRMECADIANEEGKSLVKVDEIETSLWSLFDILRGSSDPNVYYIISFFLVLKKEGLINNQLLSSHAPKKEIALLCKTFSQGHLAPLAEFYQEFASSFDSIGEQLLHNILTKISLVNFTQLGKNQFIEVFDSVLYRTARLQGKSEGGSFQPKELTTLMKSFLPTQNSVSVYNPFAGFASFALNLPIEASYFGQEINRRTWSIGKLRMIAYDCPIVYKLLNENSFEYMDSETNLLFDRIIFNAPFNLKDTGRKLSENKPFFFGNANSYIIDRCFKKLKDGGRMVFIVSNSFLGSHTSKDLRLKKYLVMNGFVEMIISLPSNIYNHTAIPSSLVVLRNSKGQSDTVLIDATKSFVEKKYRTRILNTEVILELIHRKTDDNFRRTVSNDKIAQNEFNLSFGRYLISDYLPDYDTSPMIFLGDIVSYIKPQIVNNEITGKYVRIRDLSNRQGVYNLNIEEIDDVNLNRNAAILPSNSLLLSTRFKSLKPTFFESSSEIIYYSFANILAFKVIDTKVNWEYLILELQKEYVTNQVESYSAGFTIPYISRKDILSIAVTYPSLVDQKRIVDKWKKELLHKEEENLIALQKEHLINVADQNSFLRHQIAGRLKSVRSAFKSLKKIVDIKLISSDNSFKNLKYSESASHSFGDYLNIIERDLNSIHLSVQRTGKEIELVDFNINKIDIVDHVTQYYNELKARSENKYDIRLFIDEESKEDNEVNKVQINGDSDLIRKLFDNIVENAEKHAFDGDRISKNKLDIDVFFAFDKKEVSIDFSNTGKPFPINFSFENFLRRGSKTGQNQGDGFGGWYINEIMKKHNGRIEFIDETDPNGIGDGFVSTFVLYFPIEIEKYE